MKRASINLDVENELCVEKIQSRQFETANVKVSYMGLLNIRKEPFKNADIIAKIPNKTLLKIDTTFDDNVFLKIVTEDGISGFCMKEFIKRK